MTLLSIVKHTQTWKLKSESNACENKQTYLRRNQINPWNQTLLLWLLKHITMKVLFSQIQLNNW